MQELFTAFCLVLVIEGMMPFINPAAWRAAMLRLGELDDRTIRLIGGASMLIGILLLQLLRG